MPIATDQFSPALARRIVADLFVRNPLIYWVDFLVSLSIGYTAAALYLNAPTLSVQQGVCFLIAGFALFRVGSFIHEVVHFKPGEMTSFVVAWNLLAGVPMLMPSWFYGNHIDHHNNHHYGTGQDGEYVPLGTGPLWQIVLFFVQPLVLPVFVAVRFLIITPISFLHPRLRQWTLERYSAYVLNLGYRRTTISKNAPRHWWAALDVLCWIRVLMFFIFVWAGFQDWTRVFGLYSLAVFVLTLNYIRNLTAHRYLSEGEPMSHDEQLLDSVNITGGVFTELFFPLGLRFHALHHLLPGMPYHQLGVAHRRLMANLPEDSAYRETVFPSFWSALRELLANARSASTQKPTGADVWYTSRKQWYAGDAR